MAYKILVVDDEAPVRELLTELLKKEACAVKTASSGENALEIIGLEDFDAVLLDIKMQGISGVETLKSIKALKPGLGVIMITGFGCDDELIARCQEAGCRGYISKSMPIQQIIETFRFCMSNILDKGRQD